MGEKHPKPALSRHQEKEKLKELRALSKRAKDGDDGARREIRRILDEFPETVPAAANLPRKSEEQMVETMLVSSPLMQEALLRKLEAMREDLAGENPSPLEHLLVERVVSCWLMVQIIDLLYSVGIETISISQGKYLLKWQESAHRRLLSAIKALVQVRRLSVLPRLQVNIAEQQVNVAGNPTSETSGQVRARRS